MSEKKTTYNIINIIVILISVVLFSYKYKDMEDIFAGYKVLSALILSATVIIVHILKAGRLYLALYGTEVSGTDFVKTYCKVMPISMISPYKIGEFFRMYCYGVLIGNVMKGTIIVLLDRLMDTMALVTVIILIWIFNGGMMVSFAYVLFVFLVFVLIVYFVYPGVYKFWKKYLLRAKASEDKLAALKLIDRINKIYCEVENVVKGRSIILYLISLMAWVVEIGSLHILKCVDRCGRTRIDISEYLTSAMSGSQSVELKRFVIASVVLLIVIYIIIKIVNIFNCQKEG